MGWSSAGQIMLPIIRALIRELPDNSARERVYVAIIPAFWDQDADDLGELEGKDWAFSNALAKLRSR